MVNSCKIDRLYRTAVWIMYTIILHIMPLNHRGNGYRDILIGIIVHILNSFRKPTPDILFPHVAVSLSMIRMSSKYTGQCRILLSLILELNCRSE